MANKYPGLRRRHAAYYFDCGGKPRRWIALGSDEAVAMRRYAELAAANRPVPSGPRKRSFSVLSSVPNSNGKVYFLREPTRGAIKIGFTTQRVSARVRGLETSHHGSLKILWSGPGTFADEAAFHRLFARSRIQREWFAPSDLLDIVLCLLPTLGVTGVLGHTKENLLSFTPMRGFPRFYVWAKDAGETYWPDSTDEPHPSENRPHRAIKT